MEISRCSIDDFNRIKAGISSFWGSDRTLYLHHPMLIYEFGNTAFVVKDGEEIAAYLFGFFSQTENAAYVHLVAVREAYKRRGLGLLLYRHFMQLARQHGCIKLKAITTPDNVRSIAFHTKAAGMQMTGSASHGAVPVVPDYSGPGQDRVVFEKLL